MALPVTVPSFETNSLVYAVLDVDAQAVGVGLGNHMYVVQPLDVAPDTDAIALVVDSYQQVAARGRVEKCAYGLEYGVFLHSHVALDAAGLAVYRRTHA